MNKDYAVNLIKELFENAFSKDKFTFFVKNLLNHFEEDNFIYPDRLIPKIYSNHVKSFERFGKYVDSNNKKIDLLIVTLDNEKTLENARSFQRNLIAWYLNGGNNSDLKDAALVAFISTSNSDWRFSFIKMEYKFQKNDQGLVRIKEQYTPSKRYSFLVGPSEASHTAQSRLLSLTLNDKTNPLLEEIEEIFSVEKVTKEFFEQYKRLFLNLVDEFKDNKEFQEKVVKENNIEVSDFVKKLMGQIVFLYFLQKKGWLGVKQGESWGTGDKKFMHNLFNKQYRDYENYFNDILEPLFYDTLNNKDRGNNVVTGDQSFSKYFNCRIPYLNGGLFTSVYDWKNSKIYIDDKYFKEIITVFDTFNFTVFESDPIEKEVAVDPEMLGKVFENLLEIRDRRSKGTYYTPREIVHFMCQESLINYLASRSGYPEERIRKLMVSKDQELARSTEQQERIETNEELKEVAFKVNSLLRDVKICDPAVGSGAFPMGLLKEISSTRYYLNDHFLKQKNKFNNLLTEYDIKKETLENCIYGVDIDSGAVEIARLRFWLSLVVEHDIEEIEPLPNLDYKIMQGNSLIELHSPYLIAKTEDQSRNNLLAELTLTKTEYFNLSDAIAKSKKREEINLLIKHIVNYDKEKQIKLKWKKIQAMRSQLGLFRDKKASEQLSLDDANSKEISKELEELDNIEKISNTEHFEWHLNFNEVFEQGGFDIVIANPPYVGEKGHKEIFDEIKRSNLNKFYNGQMDLFYFFFHLALNIGKLSSQIAFITTNYYLTADGAKNLRKDLHERSVVKELINFNDLKIFESALGQHNMITILEKEENENAITRTCVTNRKGVANPEILRLILNNVDAETSYYNIVQKELYDGDKLYIRIGGAGKNLSKPINSVLYKIQIAGELLGTLCNVNVGLYTGADKVTDGYIDKYKLNLTKGEGIFILTRDELKNLRPNKFEESRIVPFYKNSDVRRWFTKNEPDLYLINLSYPDVKNIKLEEIPQLYKHIVRYEKILKGRKSNDNGLRAVIKAGYWWAFTIRQINFSQPKIVSPQRSPRNTFGYNENPWYASADVYFITEKNKSVALKYILALLNSKLYYSWLYNRGKRKGETLELYQQPLSEIPIKKVPELEQTAFVEVVDKILYTTNSEDYLNDLVKQANVKDFEKQIDQMVYRLYGLTPEEIAIVEGKK